MSCRTAPINRRFPDQIEKPPAQCNDRIPSVPIFSLLLVARPVVTWTGPPVEVRREDVGSLIHRLEDGPPPSREKFPSALQENDREAVKESDQPGPWNQDAYSTGLTRGCSPETRIRLASRILHFPTTAAKPRVSTEYGGFFCVGTGIDTPGENWFCLTGLIASGRSTTISSPSRSRIRETAIMRIESIALTLVAAALPVGCANAAARVR